MNAPEVAALSVRGLSARRGGREVLSDVDLDVRRGEVVAVLGPNGAGKSTLLEAVGGVIASRGVVRVEGRVATVLQTPALARRSVRANVELALAWWGVPRGQRRKRAEGALERMRAGHLARRPAGALSGGEARRVHLARGVAVGADLLLLDEPFAGLDPETHAVLREDTTAALGSVGGGVLVVLHDRADAWAMADRVAVVMDGRLAALEAPDRLLAAPPSVPVARFLGYDGEQRDDGRVLLTRPRHVRIATDSSRDGARDGALPATVEQVVRLQDGARVRLATEAGTLWTVHGGEPPAVGDRVAVHLDGGVAFGAESTPG